MSRMERVRERQPHELEYELATGRILNIRYAPIRHGGLVLSYSDITERKLAERDVARKEAQLHVALDNMPGALAYTDDDLNIVFCNNRFTEMYPVPRELFEPGGRIPIFCAIWPSTATTARATSTRWSRAGSKACAIPSAIRSRIARRTAGSTRSTAAARRTGGTVTVITEITRLKRAEEEVARKEAELHVALDNMPGALAYTDEELNIVVCNNRFTEMYPVPRELLEPGRPYPDFLRYLAEHGYYGEGDVDALVARRVESLRNPYRHGIRGPHAGRQRLPGRPPQGRLRRHGDGDHGHHRAQARPSRACWKPSSGRGGQPAGDRKRTGRSNRCRRNCRSTCRRSSTSRSSAARRTSRSRRSARS